MTREAIANVNSEVGQLNVSVDRESERMYFQIVTPEGEESEIAVRFPAAVSLMGRLTAYLSAWQNGDLDEY